MAIYQPSDDSIFFADYLKGYLRDFEGEIEYLDMGTGSGILAETALEFLPKEAITAADIDSESIEFVRGKGFKAIKTDLFSEIEGNFDLITFNAPYLPKDSREPEDSQVATTGGEKGDEVAVRFLEGAKKHLNEGGKILLLVSSLTPMNQLEKFGPKEVARKKIFMEELVILEFG
ncbi:MAG: methyltransferase [archaeon]|nr:methyltransferase [archaeon]MCR4324036.1 methyltransferase [Nanoarchaeota archaeon]